MQAVRPYHLFSHIGLSAMAILLVPTVGCVGLVANLLHVGKGNFVPAAFDGLAGKKVAVVCVSGSASYGPTAASSMLADGIAKQLSQQIQEVVVIDSDRVEDWLDKNDWDQMDFSSLGRGVEADVVLAIDLASFSIHEGKTLYKGRADLGIEVFDISQNGKMVFQADPPQIQFPISGGHETTNISEREFQRRFVDFATFRIARHFFAYEIKDDFATDALLLN